MGVNLRALVEPRRSRFERSGDVSPEGVGKILLADQRIAAASNLVVDRIDAGRGHPDQELAARRLRPWNIVEPKDIGASELVDADSSHGASRKGNGQQVNRLISVQFRRPPSGGKGSP
jgi:hypothetical protein